jgi:hypothetical protein
MDVGENGSRDGAKIGAGSRRFSHLFVVALEDDRVEVGDDERGGQLIVVQVDVAEASMLVVDVQLKLLEIGVHVWQAVGRVDDDVGLHCRGRLFARHLPNADERLARNHRRLAPDFRRPPDRLLSSFSPFVYRQPRPSRSPR